MTRKKSPVPFGARRRKAVRLRAEPHGERAYTTTRASFLSDNREDEYVRAELRKLRRRGDVVVFPGWGRLTRL